MKDLIVKINTDVGVDVDDDDNVALQEETETATWPDLEVLDPDHPILERFQATLSRLLQEENEQLTLKILELVCLDSH